MFKSKKRRSQIKEIFFFNRSKKHFFKSKKLSLGVV